jgi:hypothetical protein
MAFNSRRQQLIAGFNKKVRIYQFNQPEDARNAVGVFETKGFASEQHSDVVSCLISCEGRYISAGYDRKIIFYDSPHHGSFSLQPTRIIKEAHDAAITCMHYAKDADNSW